MERHEQKGHEKRPRLRDQDVYMEQGKGEQKGVREEASKGRRQRGGEGKERSGDGAGKSWSEMHSDHGGVVTVNKGGVLRVERLIREACKSRIGVDVHAKKVGDVQISNRCFFGAPLARGLTPTKPCVSHRGDQVLHPFVEL